ncbi:MAG TPA: hypothetical protein VFT94_05000 [Gaiellaceae bacterium]|nr:hypothetical protein [Gaiellaceae bacterium]
MKRVLCGLLAAGAIAVVAAPVAGAGQPDNPNCFGKGASQLGQAGEMGTHSSSFDEPRSGIGNVAFENTGTHQPGELGIALGADCG